MKKKQFMSKLAALTMAAAMGLTAVPATALNVMAATAAPVSGSATQKEKDMAAAIQAAKSRKKLLKLNFTVWNTKCPALCKRMNRFRGR